MDDTVAMVVPLDSRENRDAMLRLQFALWVDEGAECAHCGHQYTSTDDMMIRNPVCGGRNPLVFVDKDCWPEYKRKHPAAFSTHPQEKGKRNL